MSISCFISHYAIISGLEYLVKILLFLIILAGLKKKTLRNFFLRWILFADLF